MEMIERVARALVAQNASQAMSDRLWRNHIRQARAAITAMRAATKEMCDAGYAQGADAAMYDVFGAMIDAALDEK